jgi:signal transduction histidine kinase
VVRDAALAVLIAVACALLDAPGVAKASVVGPDGGWWDHQRLLWWTATCLAGCAVALRRVWPLPMLALAIVSLAVTAGVVLPVLNADLSVLILLYTVAARYERAVSLSALAVLLLLTAGWSLHGPLLSRPAPTLPDPLSTAFAMPGRQLPGVVSIRGEAWITGWTSLFVIGSALLAAWAIGAGARNRRAYLDQFQARAHDLERDRDRQAQLAVAAERARISRELHDVVAHGLSVIVVQAQGGAAALDARPADTRAALAAIVRTGRESLTDVRRVLASVGVEDAWHPRPGLGQLPALLDQVREAGTAVSLTVDGEPATLPSTVDLAGYRIIQEALTNTMKHGGAGATAAVTVGYREAAVEIEVTDTGRGMVRPEGGGNGLRGMTERARLLGGTLAIGPAPGGGFRVRAILPILDGHP